MDRGWNTTWSGVKQQEEERHKYEQQSYYKQGPLFHHPARLASVPETIVPHVLQWKASFPHPCTSVLCSHCHCVWFGAVIDMSTPVSKFPMED